MSSIWMPEFRSEKPEIFERINSEQWQQHRDIHEDTITIEGLEGEEPTYEEGYAFETRILTEKEYQELMNTLCTPAYTEGADDRVAIMEALADLFELVMNSMTGGEE